MDKLNLAAVFVASLMPIFFGFIYYHPKALGNVWMRANGFTLESLKGGPKPILFLGVYVMSLMLSLWC
jgi:ABC-type thiamin/hydroxymethylpyrimidine transport system permease subunit